MPAAFRGRGPLPQRPLRTKRTPPRAGFCRRQIYGGWEVVSAPWLARLSGFAWLGFHVFPQFLLQHLNLPLNRLAFLLLARQEGAGDVQLFREALGSEQVGVGAFVLAVAEVLGLHQALFDEGAQAVVGGAQAHAQRLCQFPLGELGVVGQQAQEPQANGVAVGVQGVELGGLGI